MLRLSQWLSGEGHLKSLKYPIQQLQAVSVRWLLNPALLCTMVGIEKEICSKNGSLYMFFALRWLLACQEAEHTVGERRHLSSCGALNQLQQRRVLVKDDNYVTHTYAVLDASKQPASKGTVFSSTCSWSGDLPLVPEENFWDKWYRIFTVQVPFLLSYYQCQSTTWCTDPVKVKTSESRPLASASYFIQCCRSSDGRGITAFVPTVPMPVPNLSWFV